MATMFQWLRQRPPAVPLPIKYTSSCREDQRLSTEGKVVSKNRNISKIQRGGGRFHQPPPPFVPRWGMTLRVRPRVNKK